MRKTLLFLSIATTLLLLVGCGGSSKEVMKLVEERDSLRQQNEAQGKTLKNYNEAMSVLNATLDSIAQQENLLFVSTGETPVTKDDVKRNLSRYESILMQQCKKIDELEKKLAESGREKDEALGLISHLRAQISRKDQQISQLKAEVEKKNVDIAQLKEIVESQRITINTQSAKINELNVRTKKQGEALARQDAILNNGYVLIGSKDDLNRKGVTKKGKIVPDAVLDRTKFATVDIRKWREVSFQAKRPRILTNMPASSYQLTTDGYGNFTLIVDNPSDFWRISSYLVIQTD